MTRKIEIYTDGSCNNREPDDDLRVGGYGMVVVRPKNKNKGREKPEVILTKSIGIEAPTTSSRAEIQGMISALDYIISRSTETDIEWEIFCDSQYVIKAFTEGWLRNWKLDNFRNRKNSDLWKEMWAKWGRDLKAMQYRIKFTHIRGHRGHRFNELADDLAGEARVTKISNKKKILNEERDGKDT